MDETTITQMSRDAGEERITAENMALLCSKNVKLDIAPIQIPDITVSQVVLFFVQTADLHKTVNN